VPVQVRHHFRNALWLHLREIDGFAQAFEHLAVLDAGEHRGCIRPEPEIDYLHGGFPFLVLFPDGKLLILPDASMLKVESKHGATSERQSYQKPNEPAAPHMALPNASPPSERPLSLRGGCCNVAASINNDL
jgi:hypothetical protein